jgi:hypothetical protein
MIKAKYASRATIRKLSKLEVAERIEKAGIVLSRPEGDRLPCWFNDEADKLLETPYPWNQRTRPMAERKAEWFERQELLKDKNQEHPGSREAVFQDGLRKAVDRMGMAELNSIIKDNLFDESKLIGPCKKWTFWQWRIASRLQKQTAVLQYLDTKDREEA